MNYSLIESLLVEDIEEQEQSKKPNLENYALMIDPGRHSSTFVLYKPEYYANKIKKEVRKAKQRFNSIRFKPKQYDKFDDFYAFSNMKKVFSDPTGVVGYISINNGRIMGIRGTCNNANEIRSIAARDGFGKIMFMVALAKESPIMPRRDFRPSEYEKGFWKDMSGELNIEKKPFDNEEGMHKKTAADCMVYGDKVLDQSYKTPYDMSIETQPLTNRHKRFLNQMKNFFKENGVDYIQSRIKEYITDAGYIFHAENKGNPGWYENEMYEE